MAAKAIKTILTLQDKNFSANMKKASTGVDGFSRRMKYGSNQAKKFQSGVSASFRKVLKSAIGLAGVYIGFRALQSGMTKSIELAKAQLEAETKLRTVLQQRTNATDEQIKSILDLTSAQQRLGVIGDEVQIAGAQQIATFVNSTSAVEELLPAMNNLLAQQKGLNATQQDAVNVGNLMGKVLQGQTGALTRVGITFTKAEEQVLKYGNEQEKAAMLAKVITNNVGEMNKALAQTDQGKIQQAKNALGDMQEEIGKKLLPLQARFANWFFQKIPGIQGVLLGFVDKISIGIDGIAGYLNKVSEHPGVVWLKDVGLPGIFKGIGLVKDGAMGVFGFVSKNWGKIEPIVIGIVGALTAYKIGLAAVATKKAILFLWTNKLAIAQGLLNGVMAISPVFWIALGIGALVAAGWALYKNWDAVKAKAIEMAAVLKEKFSPMFDFFSSLWSGISSGFKGFVNIYIRGLNTIIGGLNKVKVDIPSWVPKFGGKNFGINIPKIPEFSMGTRYFSGGLARINERGGEIVDLPNGSKVIPADKSERLIGKSGGITVSMTIQGNVIGNREYALSLAGIIAKEIKTNLANAY